jgi:hypothetical protein
VKGYITADILNKACGILSEEILSAELNEFEIPHARTVPLLSKDHPVNARKPYDIMLDSVSIDVKANAPIPWKAGFECSQSLNLNLKELEHNGACDLYILTKDYPEMPFEQGPDIADEVLGLAFAQKVLRKIESVEFLGWAYGVDYIRAEHFNKRSSKPFYQLFTWEKPDFHSMPEFAAKFHIPLEPGP